MDNLSHSLVGLAAGELIQRSLAPEPDADRQSTRRRLLLLACWAASNFPDLDLFLTPLLPAPLGYLLHHRGHTHTLFYALPQGFLLWALIWAAWPSARQLLRTSALARTGMIGAIAAGLVLHLLMDSLNSYGIHPFHPFDSRWLYGDMVFIVEPVFWMAFGVPMAMMVSNLAARTALLALLAGAPLLFTLNGYLAWGSLAALLLLAVVVGAIQHRAGERGRRGLLVSLGLCLSFVGLQGFASGQARLVVAGTLQKNDPATTVVDASMTSFPSNPFCWNFVSIESNEKAGSYTLRRGIVSLAPDIMPSTACPIAFNGRNFPMNATPAIAFLSAEKDSLAVLRALQNGNCHFEAWLRFARAPSLGDTDAADIRYGLDRSSNFTTIQFAAFDGQKCPAYVPRWGFPRADLLFPDPAQPGR